MTRGRCIDPVRLAKGAVTVKINLGCGLAVAPGWINVDASLNAFFASWSSGVHKVLYKLSGSNPVTKDSQNFARECALRFAIYPQAKTRIKTIELATDFVVKKDKGVDAEVHSRLMTPSGTLAEWEKILTSNTSLKDERIAMNLTPSAEGKEVLGKLKCGDPRIFGADFTFENRRKSFKENVEMSHDEKNQVRFIIQLEPCS
jgi:hypothetical protein